MYCVTIVKVYKIDMVSKNLFKLGPIIAPRKTLNYNWSNIAPCETFIVQLVNSTILSRKDTKKHIQITK